MQTAEGKMISARKPIPRAIVSEAHQLAERLSSLTGTDYRLDVLNEGRTINVVKDGVIIDTFAYGQSLLLFLKTFINAWQQALKTVPPPEPKKRRVILRCTGALWYAFHDLRNGQYQPLKHERLPAFNLGEALSYVAEQMPEEFEIALQEA